MVQEFARHGQTTKCSQEDAGELVEHLLKHLCDETIGDDTVDYFVPTFVNVVVCKTCHESIFTPVSDTAHIPIRLPIGDLVIHHTSIQSLVWHWATSNTPYTHFQCKAKRRHHQGHNLFLHLRTVLTG